MHVALRCPRCSAPLSDDRPVHCGRCSVEWPEVAGVIDWRIDPDPYLSIEQDRSAADALWTRARSLDFPELLASYYEGNALVPPTQARAIIGATLAAPRRASTFFDQTIQQLNDDVASGRTVLDAGCGTGPLAVELARRGADVTALDIGLRWLSLARSRAASAGVSVSSCCAGVHHLPLADAQFDAVLAESLLEVVPDQARALRELHRVLRPGGAIGLSTPNRWSPGPDPHLGVPFGSWLPPAGVAVVARARGIVPPRRTLLSRQALEVLLTTAGFVDVRVEPMAIPEGFGRDGPAWLRAGVAGYRWVTSAPGLRALAAAVGPVLVATARRPVR